jgi:type I restriction enzyme S subunit
MDSIDITPNQRNTIDSPLRRHIPGVTVWAYGSRVKWTSRPDSDLDLIAFTSPEQQGRISALKEAFEESSLPFRIDVMVWDDVPESFRENILEQYVVLVEKPAKKPENQAEMEGWRLSTWGDEITLEYGKAIRGYEEATGKYRVFGSNGPIGWTTQPLAQGPGIILGRKGAYRGVQYSPDPFFVIDTAYYLVPKTELDMRWLYYAVKHYKLGEIDDGSPIPSTTRAAVYMQDIEVPPTSEQRAIAHILGTLDDKIELNRRMNETLEAMARALFKSWFVDFEPVRVKAEGRDTGLPKEIADLFPDSFEDSVLGKVPKGWKISRIEDVLELVYGKALKASERVHGTIPVYGSGGITGFHNTALVSETSVIVGRKGTVGSLYWVDDLFFPIDTVFYVKSKTPITYCFYLLQTLGLENMNTDAAVPGLNRNNVYRLLFACPSDSVLQAFDNIAKLLRGRIRSNTDQSRILTAQRDALLPKLLSGEVRVKDLSDLSDGADESDKGASL